MNRSKQTIPRSTMVAAWAIALGAIAPMLDSTMINIAIAQLTADFHTTLSIIQWAVTGYTLALTCAIPFAGWLMNRFNGKYIFIGSVIAFGLTSVLAGLSFSVTSLIIFRLLQGFSAGIITPLMSTLLVKTAGPKNIGQVISIVTTPLILGPILGPVLGGLIIQVVSWRWIFFINVLIVVIATPLMMHALPNFEPFNRTSKLDSLGIMLLASMSASLIYGITKASDYATFRNINTLMWGTIGGVLLLSYLLYNRLRHNQTVLPLTLFHQLQFRVSSIGLFLANIALIGPMMILPLFFENMRHFSAIEAALALAPQGIGMLITRPIIGKLIDQIGAKYVVIVSLIISVIGTIPLIFITNHTSILLISVALFIRGTSIGGINLPLTAGAYTGLSDQQLPAAGVGINMIENLGATFGTALIATVVATFTASSHISLATSLTGYHAGFLVSVIFLILIFIPGYFLTNKTA